jgi:hypothetical protein
MSKKFEKKKKSFFHKFKIKDLNLDTINNTLSLNELLSQFIIHHIGIH